MKLKHVFVLIDLKFRNSLFDRKGSRGVLHDTGKGSEFAPGNSRKVYMAKSPYAMYGASPTISTTWGQDAKVDLELSGWGAPFMFGMLDYRAYKLLWLICLPFQLIMWIAAWGSIVIAIMISSSLDYGVLVRIVIAYAIWEGAAIVLQIVRGILFWFIKKGFFWLVDVVPAKAASVTEAKEMVVGGPITWLDKKFQTDFGNWTEDDTEQFASLMNWRARLFFHSTERIHERIWRFQQMYEATGKQPGDLTEKERQKIIVDLDYSWFEKAIINPIAFGAIVRIIIISLAIVALDNSVR